MSRGQLRIGESPTISAALLMSLNCDLWMADGSTGSRWLTRTSAPPGKITRPSWEAASLSIARWEGFSSKLGALPGFKDKRNVRLYFLLFVSTLCSGGKHWDFNIDMEEGQPDNQVSWQKNILEKKRTYICIHIYIVLHICRTLELKIAKLQSVFVVVHIYTY